MSHFTVVVRVPGYVPQSDIQDVLHRMLLPYKEVCGDSDRVELKEFIEFEDETDKLMAEYETDTTSYVRLPDGTECSAWDHKFKNPDWKSDDRYLYPLGTVKFDKPVKEVYPTFEEYAEDYHGYKPDNNGRFGRRYNPNAKWDWWVVGGRWAGYLPAKGVDSPRMLDCCRIREIDFDFVESETTKRMNEWFQKWQEFLNGKEFDIFEGPRDKAISMGLLECKATKDLTEEDLKEKVCIPWDNGERYDVCKPMNEKELKITLREHFISIKGYARLDSNGWQAPGDMGWFGCSSDTPEEHAKYSSSTLDFYKSGDHSDWVVIVDCHI